jgi:hypothetical protein
MKMGRGESSHQRNRKGRRQTLVGITQNGGNTHASEKTDNGREQLVSQEGKTEERAVRMSEKQGRICSKARRRI